MKIVYPVRIGSRNARLLSTIDPSTMSDQKAEDEMARKKEEQEQLSRCTRLRFVARKQHLLALLTSLALFVVMGIRCNLGPAFDVLHNKNVAWIPTPVLLIDGAFHFGFILSQIPGVCLSYRFPPDRIFSYGIVLSVFVNLILPGAVNLGNGLLILLRLLQGAFEGIVIPALYRTWSVVLTKVEATPISLTFSGGLLGFASSFPISRGFSQTVGWEATFYVFAVLVVIWYASWTLLVRRTGREPVAVGTRYVIVPACPDSITALPWTEMIRSKPLFALCFVTTSMLLSVYISTTSLNVYPPSPQYHFYSTELGYSVLCAVMCLGLMVGAIGSDFLTSKNILSTTNVRKIVVSGGVGLLLPTSLVPHFIQNVIVTTTAYSCSSFLFGAALSGILVNCFDLGKYYAAVSSGVACFVCLLTCMLVYVIKVNFTTSNLNFVLLIFVGIVQLFGVLIYAVFGSADDQMWQKSSSGEPTLVRSKSTNHLNDPDQFVATDGEDEKKSWLECSLSDRDVSFDALPRDSARPDQSSDKALADTPSESEINKSDRVNERVIEKEDLTETP